MIKVTRLNGDEFLLNSDLIEIIDANPDTVITLSTGHKYVVEESIDKIVENVIEYKQKCGITLNIRRNEVE